MRSFFLTFAIVVPIVGLVWSPHPNDLVLAAVPPHGGAVLTAGPELETASDTVAIIRWTTANPGRHRPALWHRALWHRRDEPDQDRKVAQSP